MIVFKNGYGSAIYYSYRVCLGCSSWVATKSDSTQSVETTRARVPLLLIHPYISHRFHGGRVPGDRTKVREQVYEDMIKQKL